MATSLYIQIPEPHHSLYKASKQQNEGEETTWMAVLVAMMMVVNQPPTTQPNAPSTNAFDVNVQAHRTLNPDRNLHVHRDAAQGLADNVDLSNRE